MEEMKNRALSDSLIDHAELYKKIVAISKEENLSQEDLSQLGFQLNLIVSNVISELRLRIQHTALRKRLFQTNGE